MGRVACVLIVDDEIHIRHVVGWKLRQLGVRVIDASDGAAGLEAVIREKPDLIISDYQMPVMDGLEFCVRLTTLPESAETPVIMLTGRGHRVNTARLATTNVQQLFSKPFSPSELVEKAMSLLPSCAGGVAEDEAESRPGASAA